VTLHDLMWVEARRLASGFLPERLVNAAWYTANIGRAVRGARRIISISEATRTAIERVYPGHASKVRVVSHGVDRARIDAKQAAPRSALEKLLEPDVPFSVCVGQGSPYKNHQRIVEAFVRAFGSTGHRLVLVRRFSRRDRRLSKLLEQPAVKRCVTVLPYVDHEVLLALFLNARMLIFASLYEGFGLPALEAMHLGVPLVGSTTPAIREVVGDAGLLADPESVEEIADKMRLLHSDEALRQRLIDAGHARAAAFTWQKAAERTLAVYREALDLRGGDG
jgi:alpha-1,3-rhamnosyl/mannosyltransferase